MNEYLAFAGEHPIVAVLIVWAICGLLRFITAQPFRIINRILRARNIREHGWPIAPVDADGDVVYPKNEAPAS